MCRNLTHGEFLSLALAAVKSSCVTISYENVFLAHFLFFGILLEVFLFYMTYKKNPIKVLKRTKCFLLLFFLTNSMCTNVTTQQDEKVQVFLFCH